MWFVFLFGSVAKADAKRLRVRVCSGAQRVHCVRSRGVFRTWGIPRVKEPARLVKHTLYCHFKAFFWLHRRTPVRCLTTSDHRASDSSDCQLCSRLATSIHSPGKGVQALLRSARARTRSGDPTLHVANRKRTTPFAVRFQTSAPPDSPDQSARIHPAHQLGLSKPPSRQTAFDTHSFRWDLDAALFRLP
jgi:hypothetical protein